VTLAAVLPLAVVVALLASRRATLVQAGAAGLAVAAAVIAFSRPADAGAFLAAEALRGAWTAWQAVSVVLASLFFFHALGPAQAAAEARAAPSLTQREAFFACFLVGPFAESATGFGVGVLFTAHALARAGTPPRVGVALALFSQLLVPWGALAVGTNLAQAFSGLPIERIGTLSAWIIAAVLACALPPFWALARRAGAHVTARGAAEDVLWVALVAAALVAVNAAGAVDVAGVAAAGFALALHWASHSRGSGAVRMRELAAAAPYVALAAVLLATRLLPDVRAALRSHLVVEPFEGGPSFPLLYHPSVVIAAVALATAHPARGWSEVLRAAGRAARAPVLATLTFVVLAQLLAAAGLAGALGRAVQGALGRAAPLAAPALAALGGALTGSNVASNAMILPVQLAVASGAGLAPDWIAGIQNGIGSGFTLFSPSRVALGLAAVGERDERGVYRAAAPLAAVLLGVGLAFAAAVTFLGLR
jgi:lactate permease